MYDSSLCEIQHSNATPVEYVYSKEFLNGLLKAGSLISILEGKRINTSMLFALIVEKPSYQNFFVEVTASENLSCGLLSLLQINPSLVKSKITKSLIRKANARNTKTANRSRKDASEQASLSVKK